MAYLAAKIADKGLFVISVAIDVTFACNSYFLNTSLTIPNSFALEALIIYEVKT